MWTSLHVACKIDSIHLTATSTVNRNMNDWFLDKGCAAYLKIVQDSDDTVQLGIFLYPSNFNGAIRMTSMIAQDFVLNNSITGMKKRDVKLWIMKANQHLTIEVEHADTSQDASTKSRTHLHIQEDTVPPL